MSFFIEVPVAVDEYQDRYTAGVLQAALAEAGRAFAATIDGFQPSAEPTNATLAVLSGPLEVLSGSHSDDRIRVRGLVLCLTGHIVPPPDRAPVQPDAGEVGGDRPA